MKAIAAVNNGGWIGLNGKLPWRSSADFKHFKGKTNGGIMIIGGRTFREDLGGKPLPGRIMQVVGRAPDGFEYETAPSGLYYNGTLWEAVEGAAAMASNLGKDIWVIGGASIYNQLWPLITELHLSRINDDTVGDTKLELPPGFRGEIIEYHFETNKKEA